MKLVCSEAEGGDTEGLEIDGNFSDGLDRIEVKGDGAGVAMFGEGAGILNDSGFVVREEEGRETDFIPGELREIFREEACG